MDVPFTKMHGAGNDFVVIDHRAPFLPPGREALFAAMCDRRRGIGADGVLLLERDAAADFAMVYYNADGRPADYCGNGARCLARFALERGLGRGNRVRFRTAAGEQSAERLEDGRLTVAFGSVERAGAPLTVDAAGRGFEGCLIGAGVPHFVVGVERVEDVPLADWAPALRHHARFGAGGANVDFVARLAPGRVAMRTYERGVEAETLACGSGAIASAVWAAAAGERPPIAVLTAGGDALIVSLEDDAADPRRWRVLLTGPAEVVFEGTWRAAAASPAAR